ELLQRLFGLGLALGGFLLHPLLVLHVVPDGHGRAEQGEAHHGRVHQDPHPDPEDSRETDLHPAEADASRWFADGGRTADRGWRLKVTVPPRRGSPSCGRSGWEAGASVSWTAPSWTA